ncbi:hypothetical protein [Pseudoalteromonas luteoviolacea]|uniref:Uncharacterized protein n=1 Tax=Pseudoalteromonas luteoviolacea S4060-1 TaxID=1365257 RepID=A0A162BFQ0_9GAMM|nr:hypothetical protein [Pseudoalteromonas luteoviolacea]KZN61377.1 hypothetical protein N478_04735 [Pseudoalteromonas luteoviolacea S4060-1]
MKKLLIGALLSLSATANASDINCGGTVTFVMDYPSYCEGNTAFMTSGSNGKWICPPSDKGNALVLTAIASGKSVQVYINSQNNTLTCSSLSSYTKARYVVLKP